MTLIAVKHPDGGTLSGTTAAGIYASQVRVRTGAFAGREGTVTRIYHPGAIEVRFPSGPGRREMTLCFGPSELDIK